jgi:hypothetical protein
MPETLVLEGPRRLRSFMIESRPLQPGAAVYAPGSAGSATATSASGGGLCVGVGRDGGLAVELEDQRHVAGTIPVESSRANIWMAMPLNRLPRASRFPQARRWVASR